MDDYARLPSFQKRRVNMSKTLLIGTVFFSLFFVASHAAEPSTSKAHDHMQEKIGIMEEDENEDTDTLAIPLDESNVEDNIQIDQAEGVKFNPAPVPAQK